MVILGRARVEDAILNRDLGRMGEVAMTVCALLSLRIKARVPVVSLNLLLFVERSLPINHVLLALFNPIVVAQTLF